MSRTDHLPELESLRSQVAELSRTLAERDQSMEDLREQSDLLRAIVAGTATDTGEEFFRSLVRHLAQALKVRYAFVGKWHQESPDSVRILAVWSRTDFADPVEYVLQHTPCANVVGQRLCLHESGVQRLFPEDHLLAQMNVESYCGTPLFDRFGQPLGLLVVMDDRPMTRAPLVKDLLQIFAARAAAELQRQQADGALRESEQRLALAVEGSTDILWDAQRLPGVPWYAPQTSIWWSPRVRELLGLEESDSFETFEQWTARLHPDDKDRAFGQLTAHIEHRVPYDIEYRLRTNAGDYRWIHGRGQALWDEQGEPRRMSGSCQDITERKQAQDALVQSERQLRTVLDALPVGVWFTDRSGKPLSGNQTAKQIWSDVKPIGLQGSSDQSGWWETIGPVNELHRWALSHTLTTGIPSLNETLDFECLDGTKKVIRNSTVPVQDEAGNILGAIVLNEDITTLRQAQEVLRLTQFSVERAVEGFLWIGPDAMILHVNAAACQMLEYTSEELTAMTLHDIDPNFSPEVWPAHWEELKAKGSLTFESKHWSRTGRVLDMEVTINYLIYEGKEYNCAIMRDIGERRRANAALRASEERYRVLYDETPTMYFTLAMDGTVLSVNRFGAEQLGYRAEELIGHSVLGIFHEGDKETVAANLSECLATPETTRHWEFRKLRKDGTIFWVRETVRVGESSTGETIVLVACEDVTERRRTVQALTFFRTLLDYVDDSIEIIDPQTGQFLDGNRGAAANIGYTRDEFLALTVPDVDPLVTGPVFAGVVERLREAPDPIILDSIHRRKDGTTFPVEVSAQLIQLNKEYLVAIVRDITERKRVEEALRLAKFSMDRASDAVYWIDPQAKILDVNEAASSMLGYSKDELCAMTVHDLNPDFPADMWPGCWTETQRRGTMVLETAHRAKNGQLIPVEVSVNYLSHEGKEYHCAFVRNITERKQVEQEQACLIEDLTRSQQHFQTLFNWTPSAVGISTAAEGRFINVNEGFSRLTGYTREEVIGRTTSELGLWADPSERESVLREILKQGYLHNWEGLLRTKSGEIRSLMVSIHSIKLGSSPCLIYLGHDITERKRMEDALRQREGDLRAAIEERERISQDLHDGILQSLFAVGLTLEVSKSMMSTRVRKTSGASLNQAIDQLNDVMREIRNFIAGLGSDLLQGKDFSATVKHMLALLTQNQATRVRLAVEDRAAKAVSVEQSLHLFRVIQEAVSNCIRHGHAQEARVSLKMLKQGVRLSIRDNGRGFNPKAAKGTGHGLRNMAARAEKFGGRFTVLSKVNAGTRIVLDLPKEVSDVPR